MNINLEPNEQNDDDDDDDDNNNRINNLELHFHIRTQIIMKEHICVCGEIKTKFVYLSLIGSFHLGFLAKV